MIKSFFLSIFTLLLLGVFTVGAQKFTITVKGDCGLASQDSFINPDELQADFTGVNTFGEAPLSVKLFDQSIGNPTRWKWQFGDGSTDTVPTVIHVYDEPGVYTVRLTIYNDTDSASIKRIDYIRVAASGGCDSLNYPLPGDDYALYSLINIGSGYISGNNSYGTRALASFFDDFGNGSELLAGVFDFGFAERLLTNDVPVYFKVWEATGAAGSPGNVLDSVQVPISRIVEDFEFGHSTMMVFDKPVQLDGPFFLGLDLPQIYGDTLALYTNYDGDSEIANGWEQGVNGNWKPYSDTQWGLDIDNAIFPVVCQPVGIGNPIHANTLTVFPVPSKDIINYVFADVSIKVTNVQMIDMAGRQVLFGTADGSYYGNLNIDAVSEGFYFLRFETSVGVVNRKVIIGH